MVDALYAGEATWTQEKEDELEVLLRKQADAKDGETTTTITPGTTSDLDESTGAPFMVRMLVNGTPGDMNAKLKTLRNMKGFEDAQIQGDNFVFTNPDTNRKTLFDPDGMFSSLSEPMKDIFADWAREWFQGAGATAGALYGAPVAVATAGASVAAGAGLGMAAGDEIYNTLASATGQVDERTISERASNVALNVGLGATGQAAGPLIGKGLSEVARKMIRPGKPSDILKTITEYAKFHDFPTAGRATGSPFLTGLENTIARMPGGGNIIRAAETTRKKVEAMVRRRVEKLSRGKSLENEDVGISLLGDDQGSGGIKGYASRSLSESNKKFRNIINDMGGDREVRFDNVLEALQELVARTPGAEEVSGLRIGGKIQEFFQVFSKLSEENGGRISFREMHKFRQFIGNKLSDYSPIPDDLDARTYKRLYAVFTKDMLLGARQYGVEGAFKSYNKFTSEVLQRLSSVLGTLTKKMPEDAYRSMRSQLLQGSGITRLAALKKSLTQSEFDHFSSAILDDLGQALPGKRTAEFQFSLETFLTNMNKLQQNGPKATDLLFSGTRLKGLGKDMELVTSALGKYRDRAKVLFNTSNTAETAGAIGITQMAFGGGAVGLASTAYSGNTGLMLITPIVVMGIVGGSAGVGRLMTSPKFVRWLARGLKMKPNGIPAHLGRLGAVASGSTSMRPMIGEYLGMLSGRNAAGMGAAFDDPIRPDAPIRRAVRESLQATPRGPQIIKKRTMGLLGPRR
jgi:hypothetical protein